MLPGTWVIIYLFLGLLNQNVCALSKISQSINKMNTEFEMVFRIQQDIGFNLLNPHFNLLNMFCCSFLNL